MIKHAPLVPPPDDDHDCGWRAHANSLADQVAELTEKLEAMERRVFGRSSEKGKTGKMPPPVKVVRTPEQAKTARQALAALRMAKLQVEVTPVPVPQDQRTCPKCHNAEMKPVGKGKESSVVEYVPGYFRRRVYLRETLACTCGDHIVTAPAPERVGERTHYDASFIAHIVVAKCADSGPHYRQAKAYTRIGIPMSRSTLGDLFHRAARELRPLWLRLLTRIAASPHVFADETTMKVLETDSTGWVWTFLTETFIGYRFAMNRSGNTPIDVLGESTGTLICDAFTGYNRVSVPGKRVRAGCLAHARRKVFEAGEIPEAVAALELIRDIYVVEHEAKDKSIVGSAEHLKLRTVRSRPLFARLLLWARTNRRGHGPKTKIGKAARYLLNNRRALARFLRDPLLPPDNNRAESALRRVALGRGAFLFVGNEPAGQNLAINYSLVATCELNGVNPIDYIADVLKRVGTHPAKDIDELLPDRWKPGDG